NIFVFHPDGRLLIQKRAPMKRAFPDFWDISCSGHVDYCDHPNGDPNASLEAFHSAATRELVEELGISTPLIKMGEFAPFDDINIERTMFYRTVSAGPFTLQESEVSEVQWVTRESIHRLSPLTPLLRHSIQTVLKDMF
ncbi:MAG: NUDIX domain-containing protein, partial [Myxococcota bacterium]|nr:NUDIX domain-containing protein [Myxococcota bacterium]